MDFAGHDKQATHYQRNCFGRQCRMIRGNRCVPFQDKTICLDGGDDPCKVMISLFFVVSTYSTSFERDKKEYPASWGL